LNKFGKLNVKVLNTAILVIVLVVVLFQVFAGIVPEAQSAGDEMNNSNRCADVGCAWNTSSTWLEFGASCAINSSPEGNATACPHAYTVPLQGLFSGKGVVFYIIMGMLIILIVKSFIKGKK